MKSTRLFAAAVAVTAGLSLAACSSDDDSDSNGSGDSTGTTATENAQEVEQPTAEELQGILDKAVDPALPTEEKVDSVEGGEEAAELFDVMTQSKEESGATFSVVDPVLPGVTQLEAKATMEMVLPDNEEPVVIDGVQFVNDNGQWKLQRQWACTLVQNVAPDKLPALCDDVAAEQDAPAGEAPAEGAPAEEAPAEAPAA
ncbi:MAG TPA: hypothetical protein H9870_11715 [Candidatus Corynebacterium avicola]|uniref:Low molecular weight antigen MTB12-like C-terminal domain-containing protein n=1 Tax=Candidatus Corynebacterium avicola TaxID=2838527 RepID=A0A9D1RQI9_9CORY|nr:hypothetical protein [Candidatus Corynebacterium avicola]